MLGSILLDGVQEPFDPRPLAHTQSHAIHPLKHERADCWIQAMALAAAISHLQLALGNLKHVLQSVPLGEDERRRWSDGKLLVHLRTLAEHQRQPHGPVQLHKLQQARGSAWLRPPFFQNPIFITVKNDKM